MDVSHTYFFYGPSPVFHCMEKVNVSPPPVHSIAQLKSAGLSPKVTAMSPWSINNWEHPCLTQPGGPLATNYLLCCPANWFEDLTQWIWQATINAKVRRPLRAIFIFNWGDCSGRFCEKYSVLLRQGMAEEILHTLTIDCINYEGDE